MTELIETLYDLDSGESIKNILFFDTELKAYQAIANKTVAAESAGYQASDNDPMLLIACDTTIEYQIT